MKKVGFFDAIELGFKKYFDFRTRATRAEFWYWQLFTLGTGAGVIFADTEFSVGYLFIAFVLITLIPSLALIFRRLHDLNRSGGWSLLLFAPFPLGVIVLYLWLTKGSVIERNQFTDLKSLTVSEKGFIILFILFAILDASSDFSKPMRAYQIPSGSMLPTIQIGDRIIASTYTYGLKIPFTDIKLFKNPVQRRDLIIFPFPRDPSVDHLKRAVGLPGETLEIRKDQVFINGEQLDEPYAYYEPNERRTRLAQGLMSSTPVSRFGPIKIPEGKIFVMGDNRYNSADSRYWGFVDLKTVVGKGQIIYWSHDPDQSLFGGYRFARIFDFLE